MNSNEKNIHRGELLQGIVKESGMSVELLMKRLGYSSRNTFYRHVKDADLAEVILRRYGKVLKHNFDYDLGLEEPRNVAESSLPYLPDPKTLEEAVAQRDFCWKLYQQKVKDYNKLEEQYLELLGKQG